MKQKFLFLFFIFLLGLGQILKAQPEALPSFYKHFRGMLDTNMHIALDLQASSGKLTGQYNYYFQIEGNEDDYIYGKTVPVEGKIEGKNLTFHEYNAEDSKFTCRFVNENELSGTWYGGKPVKEIPFAFVEDYSGGSLPLKSHYLDRIHYLLEGDDFESISPKATIKIQMLYPEQSIPGKLKDTLDAAITLFMINKNEKIKTPRLLMENIAFDFFQSYIKTTDGISDLTNVASFNWQKELTMDALCNQQHILSLRFSKYAYTGGAHGISIMQDKVVDLRNNSILSLRDFLKTEKISELEQFLDKRLRQLNGLQKDEKLSEAGFLVDVIEATNNFYINTSGIGFFYNTYEIAPYASGTTELFLPFSEIKHLLKENHPFDWIE